MWEKLQDLVWKHILQEGRTMKSAPAACAFIAIFGGILGYGLSEKLGATQIANLQTEIGIKDSQISALQYKVDHPDQKPAATAIDPDGIYQLGAQVGVVSGAAIDLEHSEISFQTLGANGNFDQKREFSYRNYILKISKYSAAAESRTGMSALQTYYNVVAQILRKL